MNKVQRYAKPKSLGEALAAKRTDPRALWLAGGTGLLAGDARGRAESVIDIAEAVPRGILRSGGELSIGSAATFQEIADSREAPACLVEAALSMANRNTRNRATLGGNLGADKSCSSLIPLLLTLGAEVEVVSPNSPQAKRLELDAWLRSRDGATDDQGELVLRLFVPAAPGKRAAYRRWNRVACDLSVLGAAAAFALEGGSVRGLRLALGGFGPKARRFPEIEALFEGKGLPSRDAIEKAVSPLLHPIDDLRASAAFKRLRGAQLAADALLEASSLDDAERKARP
jgi:probable selenate reductase FAD-binding subunit